MTATPWVVHKFGGTSVATAQRYQQAAEILDAEPGARKAVVVSAMSGVTDALLSLVERARARDATWRDALTALHARHVEAATALLVPGDRQRFTDTLEADARDLADVLRAVWLMGTAGEAIQELVAGYGEVWSAQLLAGYLGAQGRSVRWLDARRVLVVHPGDVGPEVDWEVSRGLVSAWLAESPADTVVITGYVARTPDGAPTTLKRNGSDHSASIFGALMDAAAVTIWTDVDGVLSADPRRVPEAVVLDELSYTEAMELAYFGAKVLHPRTMAPMVSRGVPIWIRNTFNPGHPGTRIHGGAQAPGGSAVKGFSTIDGIALVNVEGTGMVGVPGVAQRIFGALGDAGVSVVMISQASSEHSVCFAVPEAQAARARMAVERAFAAEVHRGQIQKVEALLACSVLAVVGERMADTPGVASRLFSSLANAGVNVRAIAQGSSERNISLVIDRADSTRALRAAHAGFYLSNQVISVGVVGPGLVGAALLSQLEAQAPRLRERFHLDLRVTAIASSTRMTLGVPTVPPGAWSSAEAVHTPVDLAVFTRHVHAPHMPHAVIIDCTASDAVADLYPSWLDQGIHVITPNKRAGSGPLARHQAIHQTARSRRTHMLSEATVGAGLPVLTTLRDLIRTGDRVTRIEGVLSGTLSFVFNAFGTGRRFSDVVREARTLGYTEPDPRDDLAGTDVARKLVILGREMDLALERSDVTVEPLIPPALTTLDVPGFLAAVDSLDDAMAARRDAAAARGEVLRYVGVIEADGTARASLQGYPMDHPFAQVQGTDNILAFTTARYRTRPLIVQGPGAGPEVTAGGVFADLLRLAAYVGAT